MNNTALIRPGILVALKSTVTGGVRYQRVDLEQGDATARWETTRTIDDPQEHTRATKARSAALAEIRKYCAGTSFGLLCPIDREADLDAAIDRARAMVAACNSAAVYTHVSIYVLKGRIADTDEEAARAIGQEVAGLIAAMNEGIDKLDPVAIREAATKAREMSAMLSDAQMAKVSDAVNQARAAARTIVKRVEKEGELAAIVLADIKRGDIERARMAFLDLEDAPAHQESLPAIDAQRFADLDMGKES